ncbi:ABC transporter substrate-binding protein [Saccharicrinis fermentans]|uniref:ABC-type Fe(3+)-citrate transport system n=1 Tax=Saccharicrinis fermentans DSM 9555 = JCM 21142 TaxID=869213 RepID=W7XU10_9BACT|nr:ABC transporter substrate-binding protein [Saccharicrinis fermentans]GAF01505.1 ABC-type Fe(3+)-citrate transport system [Saccharicrinis fermentans DSM 9555 = JCM 21142]
MLSDNEQFLKDHPSAIKIPVEKWISVASTQICYANELQVLDQLVGMAEPQYVSNPKVKQGLKEGNIRNIGTAFAPDLELLLALNPDMMMVSPFKEDFYDPIRSAGIKITTNSSYLENTPLGRVEWLVYVAAFFNKEEEAIVKVNEIAQRYHKVKTIATSSKNKPSVFLGKVYQGVWYTAAAESYNANFLNDAGVHYVFKDRHGTGSHSYDFETVYEAAGQCDYWSITVNYEEEYSYSLLKNEDSRYADFKAFKDKNIVFSNTNHSMLYEKGLLEPDVVLSDLVKLFHPTLMQDHKLVYYKKLSKE